MKTAYLVIGPESSGTRMMTKILIEAGCAGDHDYFQKWDTQKFFGEKVVWRRSVPHAGQWISSGFMINRSINEGYTPKLIIMNRDWAPVIESQVAYKHSKDHVTALTKVKRAYKEIYDGLHSRNVDFIVISYESLIQRPSQVLKELSSFTNLPININHSIKDGNEKWFK